MPRYERGGPFLRRSPPFFVLRRFPGVFLEDFQEVLKGAVKDTRRFELRVFVWGVPYNSRVFDWGLGGVSPV